MTTPGTKPTKKIFADAHGLDQAIAFLDAGELVAIPTETVYGLAAVATDANAVAGIFAAKERPEFDPLIVHVPRAWQSCAQLIDAGIFAGDKMGPRQQLVIDTLIQAFWPGPLTIVAPKAPGIPDIVTSGLDTVGVRMPDHPVTQVLLQRIAKPLAAPSANRFGRISPTAADHVVSELNGRIAAVIDGGPCSIGLESTIVAVAANGDLTILRPGGAEVEAIEDAVHRAPSLSDITVKTLTQADASTSNTTPGKPAIVAAPGMLESHYAPEKKMLLLPSGTTKSLHARDEQTIKNLRQKVTELVPDFVNVGVVMTHGQPEILKNIFESALGVPAIVASLSPKGDMVEAARNLFAALRRMDETDNLSVIIAEQCPESTGLGYAINDRLNRASTRASKK